MRFSLRKEKEEKTVVDHSWDDVFEKEQSQVKDPTLSECHVVGEENNAISMDEDKLADETAMEVLTGKSPNPSEIEFPDKIGESSESEGEGEIQPLPQISMSDGFGQFYCCGCW